MKRMLVMTLAAGLIALSGCGKNDGKASATATPETRIVGKWKSDPAALKQMLLDEARKEQPELPPEAVKQIEELAGAMSFEVEFRKDKTCTMLIDALGQKKSASGSWSHADGTYAIKAVENGNEHAKPMDGTVKFDGERLLLEGPGGPPIPLVKA